MKQNNTFSHSSFYFALNINLMMNETPSTISQSLSLSYVVINVPNRTLHEND